ncbi:IS30 family transposase [Amycolatopsis sp. WAC 04182]|uniref:IS30 family transposase n=1 Tax=Amycolatopsis sp. WAC 04182 TaxID=2203198 RepID=UPI0018F2F302|nr:IS30 family transposase [Amycolatopsis sp. WAC 04182]
MSRGVPLRSVERELIAFGLRQGKSFREIGAWIGRDHSVVSREVDRNGGRAVYSPLVAQRRADRMRRRPKERKVLKSPFLTRVVNEGLRKKWSPMQIACRLRLEHPMDHSRWVSHEAIYQALFVQAKGTLRAEVAEGLRQGRIKRRTRSRGAELRGKIKDMVLISERPAEAEDRAVPGFWEGDLIVGANNQSQIATLVERRTRFVMLVRIPYDRTAENVAPRLAAKMNTLPDVFKNSVTWDQGGEMGSHKKFTMATGMPVYFCDPRSPWQRGSNENTNGLLRQYLPKGTDLSGYSQDELDAIADELNDRPRQTLGWLKPIEAFSKVLLD